jgi:hypothetical protein
MTAVRERGEAGRDDPGGSIVTSVPAPMERLVDPPGGELDP